jgi:aminopeptidase
MAKLYQPEDKIIHHYAQVLVNYALNSGEGVKAGEVVQVLVPDIAKPMALALQNTLLQAGAYPMLRLLPTGFDKDYYNLANMNQLQFFPKKYLQEQAKLIDHQISIIAEPYPEELQTVDPAKIFAARDARKAYRDWLTDKETIGKFTWTLALWGVEAKAKTVGLSLQDYWQQIIQACFLDAEDPIAEWKRIKSMQDSILTSLNAMEIDHLEIKGPDIDLIVKLGANRIWQGGSGRNIPSFEFFTSPDWRGTQGWVRFNQPLYRYGNVVEDIYLRFEKGLVVEATAQRGQSVLTEMLKTKNADKIGEYSLTDKRMSRITHVMAETLFDENIGGPYGNTHLAIGNAYRDCYRGDQSKVSKKEWDQLGFNNSAEHTDIISTTDRTVTAFLVDGSQRVIYQDGMFVV